MRIDSCDGCGTGSKALRAVDGGRLCIRCVSLVARLKDAEIETNNCKETKHEGTVETSQKGRKRTAPPR